MSRPERVEITCPKCGATSEFVIWKSLNNVINPQEAQKLIDGTLFDFHCPRCNSKTKVIYPCLYHDMEKHAMVQLVEEDSLDAATKIIENLSSNEILGKMVREGNYKHRFVFSPNDLMEKARIFRDELDDRAIETTKALIKARAAKDDCTMNDVVLYYADRNADGELEFAAFLVSEDGSWTSIGVLAIPKEHYKAAEDLVAEFEQELEPTYVINQDWSLSLLAEAGKLK